MKRALGILMLTLLIFNLKAQQKLQSEVKMSDIFLVINGSQIPFSIIDTHNIRKILGKPTKFVRYYSEIDEAKVPEFIYGKSVIFFDKENSMTQFDIKTKKWAFSFKIKDGFTKPITINSDISEVRKVFKVSNKSSKFPIWIYKCDCSIYIDSKNNRVTDIGFSAAID